MESVQDLNDVYKQSGFVAQPGSTFLTIPLELRQQIYEYHFRSSRLLVFLTAGLYDDAHDPKREYEEAQSTASHKHEAKLLHACKQTCEEGRSICAKNFDLIIIYLHKALCQDDFEIKRDAERLPKFITRSLRLVSIGNDHFCNRRINPLDLMKSFPSLRVLNLGSYSFRHSENFEYRLPFLEIESLNDEQLFRHIVDLNRSIKGIISAYHKTGRDDVSQLAIILLVTSGGFQHPWDDRDICQGRFCMKCYPDPMLFVFIELKTRKLVRCYENACNRQAVRRMIIDYVKQPGLQPKKDFSCTGDESRHKQMAVEWEEWSEESDSDIE